LVPRTSRRAKTKVKASHRNEVSDIPVERRASDIVFLCKEFILRKNVGGFIARALKLLKHKAELPDAKDSCWVRTISKKTVSRGENLLPQTSKEAWNSGLFRHM
jgi:hypothetical protein